MKLKYTILMCFALGLLSCSGGQKTTSSTASAIEAYQKISPDFNADSAYKFVDKQVAFGYRIPNSDAHKACGDYLVNELTRLGAVVTEQKADLKAYDGTILKSRNIIGAFNPDNAERVLLFAHWDTRPYADNDPDPNNHKKPVLGANDGASGVGVLLEIARVIQSQLPQIGIDIIFFDSEDYGTPYFAEQSQVEDSWCLGSQHWAKNPHTPNYKAKYGILLDMVAAPNATFYKEQLSMKYASGIVNKVWSTARDLGHGRYFVDGPGGTIMDDHVPVNEARRAPSIDIIQYDSKTNSGFGSYWHTVNDNMNNISKETMTAVGQTVLEVLYKENNK